MQTPHRDPANPNGPFIDQPLFVRGQIKMLLHTTQPNIGQRIAQDHVIAGDGDVGVTACAIEASAPFAGAHLSQAKGALVDLAAGPVDRLLKDEFTVRCHPAHAVDIKGLVDGAVAPNKDTVPACGAREEGCGIKGWAHGRGGRTAGCKGKNAQNAGKIFYHGGTIAPMRAGSQRWICGDDFVTLPIARGASEMADHYFWRKSVLSRDLIELRLSGDGVSETRNGRVTIIPFEAIETVRVRFAPTRLKTNRYVLMIKGKGRSIEAESTHFEGIGRFADQSKEFGAFCNALFDALARRQPGFSVQIGSPALSYLAQILFVLVGLGVLAAVLVMLPIGGASWTSYAKGAIILALLPVLGRWIMKARPRRVPVALVPRTYLPG